MNKVAKNATWIIACRVVQAVFALIINMLTARYLGPSNFGLITYASSLVAFVVPIMNLGFSAILVQEIVNNPGREGKTLGTSMFLSLCSSICCITGVTAFAFIANHDEPVTIIVCLLYSFILIFQALDLMQYWFQAKYLSKYTSIVSLCAYLVVSAYKIYLLVTAKSVYWFAISNAFDYALISISIIVIYHKLGGQKLSFQGRGTDREALTGSSGGVAQGVQSVGALTHFLGKAGHLGDTAGVVGHGAVGVSRQGDAQRGQHADSSNADAVQTHAEASGAACGEEGNDNRSSHDQDAGQGRLHAQRDTADDDGGGTGLRSVSQLLRGLIRIRGVVLGEVTDQAAADQSAEDKVCGGAHKGFHMGDSYITIDIDLGGASLTAEQLHQAETLANEAIWRDLPVTTTWFENAAAASVMPARKEINIDGRISVVTVGDPSDPFDCVACCGTHVPKLAYAQTYAPLLRSFRI